MIQEAYCSYKIGKLLLKRGYDGPVEQVYTEDGTGSTPIHVGNWRAKSKIPKITHQMAMKWLRDVYKILILVEYDYPVFSSDIYKMNDIDEYGSAKHIPPTFGNCKNYEQATEAAINYCLENLI